jgi:hypothetical protein
MFLTCVNFTSKFSTYARDFGIGMWGLGGNMDAVRVKSENRVDSKRTILKLYSYLFFIKQI